MPRGPLTGPGPPVVRRRKIALVQTATPATGNLRWSPKVVKSDPATPRYALVNNRLVNAYRNTKEPTLKLFLKLFAPWLPVLHAEHFCTEKINFSLEVQQFHKHTDRQKDRHLLQPESHHSSHTNRWDSAWESVSHKGRQWSDLGPIKMLHLNISES